MPKQTRPRVRASCPDCFAGGTVIRSGTRISRKGRQQRLQCNDCGHIWYKAIEK